MPCAFGSEGRWPITALWDKMRRMQPDARLLMQGRELYGMGNIELSSSAKGALDGRLPFRILVVAEFTSDGDLGPVAKRIVRGRNAASLLRAVRPELNGEVRSVDDFAPLVVARRMRAAGASENAVQATLARARRLEPAWRGLAMLVADEQIDVAVVPCHGEHVLGDLPELEAVLRTSRAASEPFSLVVLDVALGPNSEGIDLLERSADLARRTVTPFLMTAAAMIRERIDRWHPAIRSRYEALRGSEAARYVGLVASLVLLRGGTDLDDPPCWGSAVYSLARRFHDAIERTGACVDVVGPRGGVVASPAPGLEAVEPSLDEAREAELVDAGFIVFRHRADLGGAYLHAARTLGRAPEACPWRTSMLDDYWSESREAWSELPWVVAMCRVFRWVEDAYRSLLAEAPIDDVEKELSLWLQQFALSNDFGSRVVRTRRPLTKVRVELERTDDVEDVRVWLRFARPLWDDPRGAFPLWHCIRGVIASPNSTHVHSKHARVLLPSCEAARADPSSKSSPHPTRLRATGLAAR